MRIWAGRIPIKGESHLLVIEGKENRIKPAYLVGKEAERSRDASPCREFGIHDRFLLFEPHWHDGAEYVWDWLNNVLKSIWFFEREEG